MLNFTSRSDEPRDVSDVNIHQEKKIFWSPTSKEREMRLMINKLKAAVRSESFCSLSTFTVEDAGIFSSKPIGFTSTHTGNLDYTTPSMLFMQRGSQSGFELGSTTVPYSFRPLTQFKGHYRRL